MTREKTTSIASRTRMTRRRRSAPLRKRSPLAGPMREVVYIFEREGERGGGIWWLVLTCGHAVARKRYTTQGYPSVHLLFRPLEEKLAPKRVQCHYCGSGTEKHDPWILVKAFGGEVP
jgi:hypothetical protein